MTDNWSLIAFHVGNGHTHVGIRRTDGTVVQPKELVKFSNVLDVLGVWGELSPILQQINPWSLPEIEGVVEVLSLQYPRKLICAGANYTDHIDEMGGGPVPDGWRPFFFLLPPTTTLIGNGDAIEIDEDPAARVDWEAELAVVVGQRGSRIDAAHAMEYVAGYACLSDITARGAFSRDVALAAPFRFDWAESKGLDTFTPLGSITPTWQVPSPSNLRVRCWINGELKQDGNTTDFICGIEELVSAASHLCTLEPGDVIATGTPAGVGAARGEQLAAGDTVRVEIDGLAALENPVRLRRRLNGTQPVSAGANSTAL